MMSYLWILLLGSLLASSAKAQDDGAPAEEAVTDSQTQSPKLDPTPEANGEPEADEETNPSAVEVPPSSIEPEPTADPETEANATVTPADDNEEPTIPPGDDAEEVTPADDNEETTTPAGDDAEVVTPADDNEKPTTPAGDDEEEVTPADDNEETTTPAGDDAEDVTPADDNKEPTTPAGDDEEEVTPADDNKELVTPKGDDEEPAAPAGDDGEPEPTPAEGDVELSTAVADKEFTTTPVPVVLLEKSYPEDEQTTAITEEEKSIVNTEFTPAQEESGPDGNAKSEINQADNEKEPTDTEPTEPIRAVNQNPNAAVPSDEDNNIYTDKGEGFNLEDAVSEPNLHHSGKSRSFEPGAQAAGAKGDVDKPEPRGSSGSLAGIVSAIAVAAVGAVTGYFTYQKKKLCFKNRQEADPEAAHKADPAEAQSDPQVLSNLLNSS